jgi:hypothetical protein
VYTVFFGFLCLERGLEIFVFLEVRALLLAYLFFKVRLRRAFRLLPTYLAFLVF